MIRLAALAIVALPVVMFAWTVVGMFSPDLGMYEGSG
jgi:multisubunit Na+/H+ antiporter MnhB subunit